MYGKWHCSAVKNRLLKADRCLDFIRSTIWRKESRITALHITYKDSRRTKDSNKKCKALKLIRYFGKYL